MAGGRSHVYDTARACRLHRLHEAQRADSLAQIKKDQFEADPSKAMEAAYNEIVRLREILDAVQKALNPMPVYEFGLEYELRRPLDIRDEAFNRYEAARKAMAKY